MTQHALDIDTLRRLNRLCALGARPPVIKALLPTAHPALIRSQWEAIQHCPPPKGRLPMLVDWFLSNYQIKLHSSFIAAVWRRATASQLHFVDAYMAAYDQYLLTFPEPLLTFDRAWYLIRALSSRMMTTVQCPECNTEYIQNPDELVNHRSCPCCRVYGLRSLMPPKGESNVAETFAPIVVADHPEAVPMGKTLALFSAPVSHQSASPGL